MDELRPFDIKFQAALIRYARGMLNAWEEWIFAQAPGCAVEENADIKKHVQTINQTRRDAAPRS